MSSSDRFFLKPPGDVFFNKWKTPNRPPGQGGKSTRPVCLGPTRPNGPSPLASLASGSSVSNFQSSATGLMWFRQQKMHLLAQETLGVCSMPRGDPNEANKKKNKKASRPEQNERSRSPARASFGCTPFSCSKPQQLTLYLFDSVVGEKFEKFKRKLRILGYTAAISSRSSSREVRIRGTVSVSGRLF